jgi:hypothetical protein
MILDEVIVRKEMRCPMVLNNKLLSPSEKSYDIRCQAPGGKTILHRGFLSRSGQGWNVLRYKKFSVVRR